LFDRWQLVLLKTVILWLPIQVLLRIVCYS